MVNFVISRRGATCLEGRYQEIINLTKIISSSYANVNEVVELCLVCQRHGQKSMTCQSNTLLLEQHGL